MKITHPVCATVLFVNTSLIDEEALARAELHSDHGSVGRDIENCAYVRYQSTLLAPSIVLCSTTYQRSGCRTVVHQKSHGTH